MRHSTSRRLALAAAASLPLLTACSTMSPASTDDPFNAGNGVSAQVGDVLARNLLVVGGAKGSPGLVSGALVNTGQDPVTVSMAGQGQTSPVTIDVPAGGLVQIGGSASPATVVVPSLSGPAGSVVTLQIATAAGGQLQVKVPVLPATLEYATLTPTPTPTSTPSSSPTSTQTSTPSPSDSATSTSEPTTSPS